MANKLRGEIPFTLAGEGNVFKLSSDDLMQIKSKFGQDWFIEADEKCRFMDVDFIYFVALLGARNPDGGKFKLDLDALDCSVMDLAQVVIDGLFMSVYRRTRDEQMQEIAKELEKINEDAKAKNALSPDASLKSSETNASGQV